VEIRWTVCVQREGSAERVALVRFRRPLDTATVSDFGLSIAEGRLLLRAWQTAVAQDQVVAHPLRRVWLRKALPDLRSNIGYLAEPDGDDTYQHGGIAFARRPSCPYQVACTVARIGKRPENRPSVSLQSIARTVDGDAMRSPPTDASPNERH